MKIFSNFDTKFKERILQEKLARYTQESLFIIHRSRYYFILRVIIPLFILFWIALAAYIFLWQHDWMKYARYPLAIVWILIVWFRPVHKLLKYFYDFTIVDPHGITTYKQKGILKNSLKQIPANRIRSIWMERNSFLENIFWYGSIVILTDFTENMKIGSEDDESPSAICLTYVDNPYATKSKITDICFD